MKATVVGLVTPHVLRVIDLAGQGEAGVNVAWHLRDAVARTIGELGDQYNAPDLLSAYVQGLESAAQGAGRTRVAYAALLREAAAMAARHLERRG